MLKLKSYLFLLSWSYSDCYVKKPFVYKVLVYFNFRKSIFFFLYLIVLSEFFIVQLTCFLSQTCFFMIDVTLNRTQVYSFSVYAWSFKFCTSLVCCLFYFVGFFKFISSVLCLGSNNAKVLLDCFFDFVGNLVEIKVWNSFSSFSFNTEFSYLLEWGNLNNA